jgi:HPr kinase/phosphorylase
MAALGALPRSECRKLVRSLLRAKPACVLVTGESVPKEVLAGAEAARVTLLRTRNLAGVRKLLAQRLEPRVSMHGVLVEVFGLGTLIIGESCIGKSEAALDLVLRGHKLAADDIVVLDRAASAITGRPTDLGANLLQIRGLGIINVRDLYGDSATTASCPVGLVVELEEWRKGERYSLLGLRERRYRIQGIGIPYLKLPVRPGRTMATLIEVAARNQLLKNRGVYTARELNRRLAKRLKG